MTNVSEAFRQFQSRLQTLHYEDDAASRRARALEHLAERRLDVRGSLLTGSFTRRTKAKPFRGVDILILIDERYLAEDPELILSETRDLLTACYGDQRVAVSRRGIHVDFSGTHVGDNTVPVIVSYDVIPAVPVDGRFRIADHREREWTASDPLQHDRLAAHADEELNGQWKPLVKMIKSWNHASGGHVVPSFLLEVMALELLKGQSAGSDTENLLSFFANASRRVKDRWADPARVGPYVSDVLAADLSRMQVAEDALGRAKTFCERALLLESHGDEAAAVRTLRSLFGDLFPLA